MIGMGTTIFLVNPVNFGGVTYLLDDYSAAAAYSLRQLKTGVTNVVRVRRSSDNAESDFSASDITDGTLVAWTGANDGFVVTWYDQEGSNNITQATAANQPQIVSSGALISMASGYGIRFDGSNDGLNGSSISALSAAPITHTAVYNTDTTTSANVIFDTASGGGAAGSDRLSSFAGDAGASGILDYVRNTTPTVYSTISTPNSSTATDYLKTAVFDASKNFESFVNGTSKDTETYTGTYNNTSFNVGEHSAFFQFFDGVIGEIIIWGTDESANRTAIESDINTYYSIY